MELNMNSAAYQRPRMAKRVRLQIDKVTGKPVLLHQETVLLLNHTGYRVLRLCDGTQTIAEIIGTLAKEYQMAESTLSQDVSQFVGAISQQGLIEWV
jgi:pyrroloquinoline quinone biosynthesis protein D